MELKGSFKEPLIERSSSSHLASLQNPTKPLTFSSLIKDFTNYNPSFISTPFKGTCFQMSKDEKHFIFGSKEGRIVICDIDKKQIIMDKQLKEGAIYTLALTSDSLFSAGNEGKIKRFQTGSFSALEEIDTLDAHSTVTKIVVSEDGRFLFSSCIDGNVKMWELTGKPKSSKLYHHTASVSGLDIAEDGNNLASCALDGSLVVYNLVEKNVRHKVDIKGKLNCIKVSPRSSSLIIGGDNGEILIYTFAEMELSKRLKGHSKKITTLAVSNDEKFLVSGSEDQLIKIWDLNTPKDEKTIYGHKGTVTSLLISRDRQYIHSISNDCTIMSSKIYEFDNHVNVEIPRTLHKIIFNPKDKSFYSVSKDEIFKSKQGKFESFYKVENKSILSVNLIKASTEIVVFLKLEKSTDIEVYTHSLTNSEKKNISLKTRSLVFSATASEDGAFLFTGEAFRISVWLTSNREVAYVFKSHTGDVKALEMVNSHLFAGDSKGLVKYYHIQDGFHEISQFVYESAGAIKEIKVSKKMTELVYSTMNNFVLIWSIASKTLVREIKLSNVAKHLYINYDSDKLLFSYSNHIEFWNLNYFSKLFKLTMKEKIHFLGLKDQESHLLIGFEKHMQVLQNPLLVNQFSIYGHNDRAGQFLDYVNKIIRGEVPTYEEPMNDWLVAPYQMNILHIYSYYNLREHLLKSLESNAPFFLSRDGSSPLSISVDKKLQECIDVIITQFKKSFTSNPFVFSCFSDILPELNRSSYPKLHHVYDLIYSKAFNKDLPKFCDSRKTLPIIKFSKKKLFPRNKFLKDESYAKEETSVEFMQTFVVLPVVSGSNASLEFLSSLTECKNLEVFSTGLVQLILNEKWKKIKWIYAAEAILYVVYLLFLCLFILDKDLRSSYLLVPPLCISILLFLNELIQMAYSKLDYFCNFWNIIDILRVVFFTSYFVIIWENFNDNLTRDLIEISTLVLSLIRGVSYFRIHPNTRFIITLIFEVCYQLWAMISVAVYAMAALAVLYGSLRSENISFNIDEEIQSVEYEWFMIIAMILINPMIILNLFIAIIADSFEKSQDEQKVNNGKELAEMIFEAELLMIWRRGKNAKRFLGVLREEHFELLSQSTPGQRMKRIADSVEELNGIAGKNKEEIEEMKKYVELKVKAILEKTNKVLEKINN